MKTLKVGIFCQGYYRSEVEVPENYDLNQAIEYAKEHINEIPILSEIEYVSDSDEVDKENCEFV